MLPSMMNKYGNPHSRTHAYGWDAEKSVEAGRVQVASLINAQSPKEITFTSGATESNNLAIKGVATFYGAKKKHVITAVTEHKCVLDSCRWLETRGFEITYLPVEVGTGQVNLAQLEAAIRPGQTSLISLMAVNNETGSVLPLAKVGALARKHGVFFHTDAAQMCGKLPIDVEAMNIDLLSMSGHKLYGPKGIGALYVRRRPRVRLEPIFSGGGQERGLRSGTVPPPLVVGLGKACAVAQEEMAYDARHVKRLSDRLRMGIEKRISHVIFNGGSAAGQDESAGYPGCVNASFSFVEGESLLMALKSVAVSSGSACTSASLEPSYVLRALGVNDDMAHSSLRFGIGRFTTEQEIDYVVDMLEKHVGRLREMSPLWEMVQEGIDLKSIQWTQDAHH